MIQALKQVCPLCNLFSEYLGGLTAPIPLVSSDAPSVEQPTPVAGVRGRSPQLSLLGPALSSSTAVQLFMPSDNFFHLLFWFSGELIGIT